MDFPSYREAFAAGEQDGLTGTPRRSTAPAYTKGYYAAFTLRISRCPYCGEGYAKHEYQSPTSCVLTSAPEGDLPGYVRSVA